MTDHSAIPFDEPTGLQLPAVDYLAVEPGADAYVVTFVPEDAVSAEPKEVVVIPLASAEGRHVHTQLQTLEQAAGAGSPVRVITHGGECSFTLQFASGRVLESGRLAAAAAAQNALARIAIAAQNAFLIKRANSAA